MTTELTVGLAWVTDCVRCANEGISYTALAEDALTELAQSGWSEDGMCPACNGGQR